MKVKKTITATGELPMTLELDVIRRPLEIYIVVVECKLAIFDNRPVVLPAQTGFDGLEHGFVVETLPTEDIADQGLSDADIVDQWFNSEYGVA